MQSASFRSLTATWTSHWSSQPHRRGVSKGVQLQQVASPHFRRAARPLTRHQVSFTTIRSEAHAPLPSSLAPPRGLPQVRGKSPFTASGLSTSSEALTDEESTPIFTIEECLDGAGLGRYQITALILLAWSFAHPGFAAMICLFTETPTTIGVLWNVSQIDIAALTSVFFAGSMVGALVSGSLADRYGRRTTWLAFNFLSAVCFTLSSFAPNYLCYAVMRFLVGLTVQGAGITAFGLAAEVVGSAYRPMLGALFNCVFAGAIVVLAGLGAVLGPATSSLTWSQFTLFASALAWVTVPFSLQVLESPLWLSSVGRSRDAVATLEQMAKLNSEALPAGKLAAGGAAAGEAVSASMAELFTSWPALRLTIGVTILWAGSTMCYYGLGLDAGAGGGSVAGNLGMLAAVEVPAYLLAGKLTGHPAVGRKGAVLLLLGLGAACCLVKAAALHGALALSPPLLTTVALAGKMCISGVFCTVYVYTSELFPTSVRSSALGYSSACARVGAALAPFVIVLASLSAALPQFVFGLTGAAAMITVWFLLQETYGQPLKESFA